MGILKMIELFVLIVVIILLIVGMSFLISQTTSKLSNIDNDNANAQNFEEEELLNQGNPNAPRTQTLVNQNDIDPNKKYTKKEHHKMEKRKAKEEEREFNKQMLDERKQRKKEKKKKKKKIPKKKKKKKKKK